MPNHPPSHPPVELASGIDALYMSARGRVPDWLIDDLDNAREDARELQGPVPFHFGGVDVEVMPNAFGKYAYRLRHPLALIGVTPSVSLPSVRIQPTSRALHGLGATTTVAWVRDVLDRAGIDAVLHVTRLDLHSDWQGVTIGAEERQNFVKYSDHRGLREVGEELTGLDFGTRGGALYARLYDKTRHVAKTGDDWWFELWGSAFDPERPVLRVEFEFTREALREFGLTTPEDVFDRTGPLWAYATTNWLSLRIPTGDGTRSRWPVDPRWAVIQRSALAGNALPAERITAGKHAGTLRKLMDQLVGLLTSAAVPLGTSDYDDTVNALRRHVVHHEQRTGIPFDVRVATKRNR